jgi:demethylmenaquinone methyltransferase/2-methoxy-6-polyprenyl-1,4-benzoquinol methylase
VVVLEITTPVRPPLSTFYALWFDRVVPLLGRAAQAVARALSGLRSTAGSGMENGSNGASHAPSGIAAAYTYLPNSVKRFPAPAALAAELDRAGLQEISYVLLGGGIVAIHAGTVPAGAMRDGERR